MMKHAWALAALVMLGITTVASATPVVIVGDVPNSESQLGDFKATLTYVATNATTATLTVAIENTTPIANGGYLTGFVLNNPNGAIDITKLLRGASDVTGTELLGVADFDNDDVNGQPFGKFDFGWALGKNFEGGGTPSNGIGVGSSETFTFHIEGTGLDLLTSQDFADTSSTPQNSNGKTAIFLARFKSLGDDEEDSDKVPGQIEIVPEPASLLVWSLIGLGAIPGAVAYRRRNAK